MEGSEAEHKLRCHLIVGGEHRTCQASSATPREINCLLSVRIRHDRTDRSERLDGMNRLGTRGVTTVEQRRRYERAFLQISSNDLELLSSVDNLGLLLELAQLVQHLTPLARRGDRPHAHILQTRITHCDLAQRSP